MEHIIKGETFNYFDNGTDIVNDNFTDLMWAKKGHEAVGNPEDRLRHLTVQIPGRAGCRVDTVGSTF
ncbi:MAG: hypothetical protein NTZ78_05670 [Candidatus Aureabacteria bacterium]|nr:hypothetical protein [Candidatus Auribacterota bacterium]